MKQTTSQTRKSRYTRRKQHGKKRMENHDNSGLPKAYQVVTDKIITLLEQGVVPWRRPWKRMGAPKNLQSGNPYRGINTFMLNATGAECGYGSPYWITFKQALDRGGNVRKGEHGTPIVFWKMLDRKSDTDEPADADDESGDARRVPLIRYSMIFNVEQCDGLEYPTPTLSGVENPFNTIEACEELVAKMPCPPTLNHGGDRAFYRSSTDSVTLPKPEDFENPAAYYCTLFHELTHATGHTTRLNRPGIVNPTSFGSPEYAREELIAEMGAAFLCNQTGIDPLTIDNTASYLKSWISTLRGNPRLVVVAASQAQKASDFIVGADNLNTHSQVQVETLHSKGFGR